MLQSDLYDYSDAYIIIKGTIIVTGANYGDRKIGLQHLKTMLHLLAVYQRSIMH